MAHHVPRPRPTPTATRPGDLDELGAVALLLAEEHLRRASQRRAVAAFDPRPPALIPTLAELDALITPPAQDLGRWQMAATATYVPPRKNIEDFERHLRRARRDAAALPTADG